MSNNATQQTITPAQALQVLRDLAALPTVKLNLAEHSAVQQSLEVLRQVVEKPELTIAPNLPTT